AAGRQPRRGADGVDVAVAVGCVRFIDLYRHTLILHDHRRLDAGFRTLVGMPMIVEGVEYLTAAEAATALGVKRETLYAYASRGRLRSYRRGTGRARLY